MSRTGVMLAFLAVMLVAPGCGGGEDRAPADPVEDAGPDGAASDVETAGDTSQDAPASLEADLGGNVVADAPRVQLGDRFSWCAKVQALWDAEDGARAETEATAAVHWDAVGILEAATDDLDRAEAQEAVEQALGDHSRARTHYGHARSLAAGLFDGESTLLVGDPRDATLQVALERAFEAFLASAGADTLAVLDLAQKATETAQQPRPARPSEDEESNPSAEVAESEPAPVDPSEAWFEATEALEDAIKAAEKAAVANDAAEASAAASHNAVADAKDAAWAIVRATELDGVWEAMIADIDSHLQTALSAVRTGEDSEREALAAQAAAAAAAAAAVTAAEASEAARAIAEQSGSTEGAQAYWDAYAKASAPQRDARYSAYATGASAGTATRNVAAAATAAASAARHAAQFFAGVDAQGVAAFKESLQQSCL
ncbi:MAG: hypothetical protein F4Z28_08465 [Gammaproteobacteria bacterium]|nr:hypothetical protein [Gammaproteobacteria bacterium]